MSIKIINDPIYGFIKMLAKMRATVKPVSAFWNVIRASTPSRVTRAAAGWLRPDENSEPWPAPGSAGSRGSAGAIGGL